jgi:hypothetical protein
MHSWRGLVVGLIAAIAAVVVIGSCVDERVVFRDTQFPQPPSAAAGFVGYSRKDVKQSVCGNCHIDPHNKWKRTAHADAWATLQESGHAETFCEACHSVNQRGNASPDSGGGFVATRDDRYHDVQCESCHGPGLDHVTSPTLANRPLATIAVGLDLDVGCGECHNGTHHPFVEEWASSGHGRVEASPSTRAECIGCHTAQGVLAAWNVRTEYQERTSTTPQPIVCAVCHDPHSNEASRSPDAPATGPLSNPESGGQLRYPIDVPDEEQNLCMKCHHKRAQPDIDPVTVNSRGPHSPEGPLLLGEDVGFWFSDTPIDNEEIVGTHGTQANPRLCAGCHMQRFAVNDALTGDFVIQAVGHTFQAIPCVDGNGQPTGEDDCAVTERRFANCATSGCHGSEAAARSAFTVVNARIASLAAQLKAQIDQVRSTEISANDGKWTSAEGANFNYQLAVFPGSAVHNPFMIEALLLASISEMQRRYGLTVSPNLNLKRTLRAPAAHRSSE